MNRLNFIFGSLGGMCLLAILISSGPPSTNPTAPIKLAEINARGIEGQLGKRLGTIVEIAGTVVAKTNKANIDLDVPFYLNITHVDGQRLSMNVLERFRHANQGVALKEPKVGDDFRYVGYESGYYDGSPAGEEKYVERNVTQGYGFSTHFLILAKK